MIESFISADSHVVEPADLWTTRMDRRFRERAPHFEHGATGDHWVVEGLNSLPIGLFGPMVSEKAKGGIDDRGQERRHDETRPGAHNPEARIVDQRLDHVERRCRAPDLADRHGTVEGDDRRGLQPFQRRIELVDFRPVGIRRPCRVGVHPGDRGLHLVRAGPAVTERFVEERQSPPR